MKKDTLKKDDNEDKKEEGVKIRGKLNLKGKMYMYIQHEEGWLSNTEINSVNFFASSKDSRRRLSPDPPCRNTAAYSGSWLVAPW
jgi:hypothetical protein